MSKLLAVTSLRFINLIVLVVLAVGANSAWAGSFPGGFIEGANSTDVRPRATPAQIPGFPERGKFTFPPSL